LFNDDNSSAGSYNDTVPERKNSDLEEDMLPNQKSNNRKKNSQRRRRNVLCHKTIKPAHAVICIKNSPFSCPVIGNFTWIEPLLSGHMSYNAT
jgi:hypothetical protein